MAANQYTFTPPRRVIIVGHAIENDLEPIEDLLGMRLRTLIPNYWGELDTQVIAENHEDVPVGLAKLASTYCYGFHPYVQQKYWEDGELKTGTHYSFEGQHNAMNDSVATLKVLLAEALDPRLNPTANDPNTPDFDKLLALLQAPNDQIPILIAMDVERKDYYDDKEKSVYEVGIAWIDISSLVNKVSGENGQGWHRYMESKLFRIIPHEGYRMNKHWCASPPEEFEPLRVKTKLVHTEQLLPEFRRIFHAIGAI